LPFLLLKKLIILTLFVLVLTLSSCAPSQDAQIPLKQTWTFEGRLPDGQSKTITGLHLPGTIDAASRGWVKLSTSFTVPNNGRGIPETWLSLGRLAFPMEVWVNGVFLYRRGITPPDTPFVLPLQPTVFMIPTSLLKPGQENQLELNIWKTSKSLKFYDPIALVGRQTADFQLNVVTFLNLTLFLVFAGINTLAGLYFLALWLGNRKALNQLYFSLSTLLIGIYFFSLGSPVPLLPGILAFTIPKACLSLSVAFYLFFLIEHFNLFKRRWIQNAIFVIFALSALWVAFATSVSDLDTRFTLSVIPLELGILFSVWVVGEALRQHKPQAGVLAVGIVVVVILGSHDVWYQLEGRLPLLWFQGIGYFALEFSMFLSLAIQSNQILLALENNVLILAKSNENFERFVPKDFLTSLGKASINEVQLGQQSQLHMAVLFADIRRFSTLAESMGPENTFLFLNSYYSRVGPVVRQNGGFIDKYIGDGFMALFQQEPRSCLQAAVELQSTLVVYNRHRANMGYLPVKVGCGIHSGRLVLGTIGEDRRMDTTVISDVVNLASRLESLTKVLGEGTMVSLEFLESLKNEGEYHWRYAGVVRMYGKSQPIEVVHVWDGLSEEKCALYQTTKPRFEEGLSLYRSGELVKAQSAFQEIVVHHPEDAGAQYYLQRCLALKDKDLPPNWDGIEDQTFK
jgi:class 3 adenylate cyclase